MLISHDKKFIFIHNYKVAGRSVRTALDPYDYKPYKGAKFVEKAKRTLGINTKIHASQFDFHVKANELKEGLPPEIFNEYYKFGFVRNPWDWQVSQYTYSLKNEKHFQHDLIKSMKSFEEYIEWRVTEDKHLQKRFFYDGDTLLVDFVGKMENLNEDFSKVCDKLGLEVTLPHVNSSRNRSKSFHSFYTQETIDKIYDAFYEDIRLFDYDKPVL